MKLNWTLCAFLLTFLPNISHAEKIKDCGSIDWFEKGQIDAAKELSIKQVDKHIKTCKKQNVTVSKEKYIAGYEFNLQGMCTFEKGLDEGKKGLKALKNCPESSEYLAGHKKGSKSARDDKVMALERMQRSNELLVKTKEEERSKQQNMNTPVTGQPR